MPEILITQQEIETLASKFDQMELTDKERALLSGIFTLASDLITRAPDISEKPVVARDSSTEATVTVYVEDPLPSLQDQFREAFSPGIVGNRGILLSARFLPPPAGNV